MKLHRKWLRQVLLSYLNHVATLYWPHDCCFLFGFLFLLKNNGMVKKYTCCCSSELVYKDLLQSDDYYIFKNKSQTFLHYICLQLFLFGQLSTQHHSVEGMFIRNLCPECNAWLPWSQVHFNLFDFAGFYSEDNCVDWWRMVLCCTGNSPTCTPLIAGAQIGSVFQDAHMKWNARMFQAPSLWSWFAIW